MNSGPLLAADTRAVLGSDAMLCDSRSLWLERYAQPDAKDQAKRLFFDKAIKHCAPAPSKAVAWMRFLTRDLNLAPNELLFGQLESRLLLNTAGGVMENAGISLDRFSGLPLIPGSALKGCARRAALLEISEAAGVACQAELVAEAGICFGWSETDWSEGRKTAGRGERSELLSDFEWACGDGDRWKEVRELASAQIASQMNLRLPGKQPPHRELTAFAGSFAFLRSFPIEPLKRDLEVDILSCHHADYYMGDRKPIAFDDESPIPVFFPAIAAGHIFVFASLTLRANQSHLLPRVHDWMRSGLSTFGIGAKTAAGYGTFSFSGESREREKIALQNERVQKESERSSLQPDPARLEAFSKLKPDQLRGELNAFATEERFWTKKDEAHQLSLLHYATVINRVLYESEKPNLKSKLIKALTQLAAKFGHSLP